MAKNKILPCFEYIFGLSRTECECTDDGKPEDADVSTSGLYLDELEGGINFESINTDNCADAWDKMEAARVQGIEETQNDITIALNTLYKQNKSMFKGVIGKPETTGNNATSFNFVGMRLRAEPYSDAQITITGGTIHLDTAITGDIIVLKGYQKCPTVPVVVATIPFTSVAGMVATVTFDEPLILPMYDEKMIPVDYFFMYEKPVGVQPANNHATCNCGGQERILKEYVYPAGVYADSLDNLYGLNSDKFANGLTLTAFIGCKSDLLLCSSMSEEPEIFLVSAYASLFKAGAKLIRDVLKSGDVSRYTMMNRESLYGKAKHFEKEYNARIEYIAANIDIDNSDCYTCNDNRILKGKIKI